MHQTQPPTDSNLTYLALGDSYTIGESVAQKESFPFQLVEQLKGSGYQFLAPKIIAKTGWTTNELQDGIKLSGVEAKYDVVTLLIGVNNQYRGYAINAYHKEFKDLLQTAVNFAGGHKKRVFVISIPDWGVTPFGKSSGRSQNDIAEKIDEFNKVCEAETLGQGISYTNITQGSRAAESTISLIASDGLHPSGQMYAEWAAALVPKILFALK
jgi:lysophospholipase L1-like esterase